MELRLAAGDHSVTAVDLTRKIKEDVTENKDGRELVDCRPSGTGHKTCLGWLPTLDITEEPSLHPAWSSLNLVYPNS